MPEGLGKDNGNRDNGNGEEKEELVISVRDVTKIYKLYEKPIDRLKESLSFTHRNYHRDFYALNHISFSVRKGEAVGIIGTNGSGKSTMLKIITGVLTESSGTVETKGTVCALLELGAGFNQDYTGIENIYMNGTMMGFTREEMDRKLPVILEFADIGDFVRQPVKSYSSGMFVRLAFALYVSMDPDVLIVDEALSVGDVFFQAKCYHRMDQLKRRGTTILMVTHDLGSVMKYCDRVVLINKGEKVSEGPPGEMVDLYKKILAGHDPGVHDGKAIEGKGSALTEAAFAGGSSFDAVAHESGAAAGSNGMGNAVVNASGADIAGGEAHSSHGGSITERADGRGIAEGEARDGHGNGIIERADGRSITESAVGRAHGGGIAKGTDGRSITENATHSSQGSGITEDAANGAAHSGSEDGIKRDADGIASGTGAGTIRPGTAGGGVGDGGVLMQSKLALNPDVKHYGNGKAEIYDFGILDEKGRVTNVVLKGEYFSIKEVIRFHDRVESPIFTFTIKDKRGMDLSGTNTMYEGEEIPPVKDGDEYICTFRQRMSLQGGEYLLSMSCTGFEQGVHTVYDRKYDVASITVLSNKNTVGIYDMESVVALERHDA